MNKWIAQVEWVLAKAIKLSFAIASHSYTQKYRVIHTYLKLKPILPLQSDYSDNCFCTCLMAPPTAKLLITCATLTHMLYSPVLGNCLIEKFLKYRLAMKKAAYSKCYHEFNPFLLRKAIYSIYNIMLQWYTIFR